MKFAGTLVLVFSIGGFIGWCLHHHHRHDLPNIPADDLLVSDSGNDSDENVTIFQQVHIKEAASSSAAGAKKHPGNHDDDDESFVHYLRSKQPSNSKEASTTSADDDVPFSTNDISNKVEPSQQIKEGPTSQNTACAPKLPGDNDDRSHSNPPQQTGTPKLSSNNNGQSKSINTNLPQSATNETSFKGFDSDEWLPQVITTDKCDLLPLADGQNDWNWRQNKIVRKHKDATHICGPKILIVGAMKCGTNTLGQILQKHPRIKVNRCRGIVFECNPITFQGAPKDHFWEGNDMTVHHAHHPDNWFEAWMQRLPWTDGVHSIAIDKSPSYVNTIVWEDIANKVHKVLPSAKVIMTICNPAERVYSEYHHYHDRHGPSALEWKEKFEKHGFGDAVDHFDNFTDFLFLPENSPRCQGDNHDFCHDYTKVVLGNGQYDTHVKAWREAYGNDNVLVLNMEDDNKQKAQRILQHVGLPFSEYPWYQLQKETDASYANTAYAGRSSLPQKFPDSMKKLQEYFYSHNEALAELLNDNFPLQWNEEPSKN